MRIAVVGGTGLVGKHVLGALARSGHEGVVIARSRGVDVLGGQGLDAALKGVEAVIDVMNAPPGTAAATREYFARATRTLLAAEERAGVKHHVLLSIVGIERVPDNPHYAGKLEQEALLASAAGRVTIQRATQFHEFPATVVGWVRQGDVAQLPPLVLQPADVGEVAEVLVEVATRPPQGRARDLAGPRREQLIDMAERTLAARGDSVRILPAAGGGLLGASATGDALLPGPNARLLNTTFAAWLERQSASTATVRAPEAAGGSAS